MNSSRFTPKELFEEFNKHVSNIGKLALSLFGGWLNIFKKRYGLSFWLVHGEEIDANDDAICTFMPRLMNMISKFEIKDVWNAECRLFYWRPSNWPLQKPVSGFEAKKSYLTFLASCKNDGTEKMPLVVVEKALRPRAYKKNYVQKLGFEYHANK